MDVPNLDKSRVRAIDCSFGSKCMLTLSLLFALGSSLSQEATRRDLLTGGCLGMVRNVAVLCVYDDVQRFTYRMEKRVTRQDRTGVWSSMHVY